MENFNRAVVDGAHVVARVVEYHVRQATTSAMQTGSVTPSPSLPPAMSSSVDPATSPTPTDTKKDNGGGGSSSPLLFFVALGFGVVFTNLWIIVGVKYCFRYNARNRALARLDENGEPIDLQNMPARPHRRRREKKLMTMDEVNEKFPMVKYKTWVLERRREGLPTTGGISAPPSRANSVRSVEGIVPVEPDPQRRDSTTEPATDTVREPDHVAQTQPETTNKDQAESGDKAPDTTPLAAAPTASPTNDTTRATVPETETPLAKDSLHRMSEDDDEDDDDHINHALDPDMMGSSGDTCAICIDTLEDNDDVRGLTCGHAFHAVCLDPWLTNRRACCPLCKADYYTPKARPQPAEGEARDPHMPAANPDPSRNIGRMNYPRTPARSFAWSHFRDAPRQIFPSNFENQERDQAQVDRYYRARRQATQSSHHATPGDNHGNFLTRFRNRFPPFVLDRAMRNREVQAVEAQAARADPSRPNTGAVPAPASPSQLEAGVRPSTTPPN
ncbi:hypothetical protein F5Y14DRAFT_397164 [Nemania sp. NC0429]|nr:hypothetical protein F5Y14DRAFT_397164 [Nemania sp. NC0429]